jgi:glutaredoxin
MEPGRCTVHGLIVARDGRCVICRRGDSSSDETSSSKTISGSTWTLIVGGALLIGIGVFVIYKDPFRSRATPVFDMGQSGVTKTEDLGEQLPPAPRPHHPPIFITDKPAASATPSALEPAALDAKQLERIDELKKHVQIKMYSTATDPLCERVRTYFKKRGYTFIDYDIDKSDTDKIEMKSLNPAGTVPTFDIEGTVLVGMDREEFEATLTRIAEAKLKQAGS